MGSRTLVFLGNKSKTIVFINRTFLYNFNEPCISFGKHALQGSRRGSRTFVFLGNQTNTEFSYIACAVCFRFCVWRGIGEIQAALLPRSATHRQVRFAMSFGVNGFLCNLCTGSFQISARQRPGAKVSSRSYKIGFERPKLWDFSKSYIRLILKTGTLGPF
jgi:hypothetical protein